MKKPFLKRMGDFLEGKGFYIVLFLCVAAIGISGYYLFSSLTPDEPDAPASMVMARAVSWVESEFIAVWSAGAG